MGLPGSRTLRHGLVWDAGHLTSEVVRNLSRSYLLLQVCGRYLTTTHAPLPRTDSLLQIAGSFVQYFALIYVASNALISSLSIWGVLKMLTVVRMGGGGWCAALGCPGGWGACVCCVLLSCLHAEAGSKAFG